MNQRPFFCRAQKLTLLKLSLLLALTSLARHFCLKHTLIGCLPSGML